MAEQHVASVSGSFNSQLIQGPLSDPQIDGLLDELHDLIHGRMLSPVDGERVTSIRTAIRVEFGRRRGWRWSEAAYSGHQLLRKRRSPALNPPHLDHPGGYSADGRIVSIISQPYGDAPEKRNDMRSWAAAHDCMVEFPDFPSWWYPGWTFLCVFTRKPKGTQT